MPFLSAVSVAPASTSYTLPEILVAAGSWLSGHPTQLELFERFHRASRTASRSYVISLDKILELESQADRAAKFVEYGLPLACKAVTGALEKAKLTPDQIGTVIFTSCTAPLIPTIDVLFMQHLGFSPSTRRIPMYQQGCAGGVVGMGLASRLSASGENVLLVSVELCSLLFRLKESDAVHLLGSALFADGAAASVISPTEGSLRLVDSQSHLIPETVHLMGYELRDDGAHLRLDRELPSVLHGTFLSVLNDFLAKHSLRPDEVKRWIIHPGGVRILEGLSQLLELKPEQYSWSYDILSEVGNVSSATVQFVLEKCLAKESLETGEKVMMVGIGPGLTVELILFENAAR